MSKITVFPRAAFGLSPGDDSYVLFADHLKEVGRLKEKMDKTNLAFMLSDAILPPDFEPELPPTIRLHRFIEKQRIELGRLEAEIKSCLELIPPELRVVVREGAGPENASASLAVSVAKLVKKVEAGDADIANLREQLESEARADVEINDQVGRYMADTERMLDALDSRFLAATKPARINYAGIPVAEGARTYGNCKVCGALLVKDWCLSCGTPREKPPEKGARP